MNPVPPPGLCDDALPFRRRCPLAAYCDKKIAKIVMFLDDSRFALDEPQFVLQPGHACMRLAMFERTRQKSLDGLFGGGECANEFGTSLFECFAFVPDGSVGNR